MIVAAGGIGSPILLRNSGIDRAGRGMTMDITAMVYGYAPFKGMGPDPPMTWSCPDDDLGVLADTVHQLMGLDDEREGGAGRACEERDAKESGHRGEAPDVQRRQH